MPRGSSSRSAAAPPSHAYARQFSEASTAAVGGDLGWVRAEQLPDELAGAGPRRCRSARSAIRSPIPGGFSIIALADTRQVLDRRSARRGAQPEADVDRACRAGTPDGRRPRRAVQQLGQRHPGDGRLRRRRGGGADDRRRGRRQRPGPGARPAAGAAADAARPQRRPGDAAVRLADERVSVLVLCGRDDPAAGDRPELRRRSTTRSTEERVNRRAQRYLRDLRRDAVIDYR